MKQADESVLEGDLLHRVHCKLVVVACEVCVCEYWGKLVLRRRNLVVLCLGKYSKLPELLVKVLHEGCDSWLDGSEVMVLELLALWRLRSEECPSCILEVLPLFKERLVDKEVFLLRSHRSYYPRGLHVSEELQYPQRLSVHDFHGPEERCLLVKHFACI